MNISANEQVNSFLSDIQLTSSKQFDTIIKIRKGFFRIHQNLSENIKYGGIIFSRLNTSVAGVFVYKKHISIEFSQGAEFEDDHSMLEGNGKFRRHIKIYTNDDIEAKNCEYYIKQACNH